MSSERERDVDAALPVESERKEKAKRRLSGPAWHMTPMHHAPEHIVDAHHSSRHGHGHGHATHHPYHPASHHHHQHHHAHHEESPSPISTDSEGFAAGAYPSMSPPNTFTVHPHGPSYPPQPYVRSYPPSRGELAMTPSTSPFLGPMRSLNIHSTDISRAPSPILLPPASMGDTDSKYGYGPRMRKTSGPHSPPTAHKHKRRLSFDGLHQPYPPSAPPAGQFHFGPIPGAPTPQLSSGPSSSSGGSSPRSYTASIGGSSTHHGSGFHFSSAVGSATSSRAPSPPPTWPASSASSSHSHVHHAPNSGHHAPHNPHHLAHSVRLAFGMTPIHATTARSHISTPYHPNPSMSSNSSSYFASVPASRSGSPPITLPPLKMKSRPGSPHPQSPSPIDEDSEKDEEKTQKEKVELPHFSEFEAATGAGEARQRAHGFPGR